MLKTSLIVILVGAFSFSAAQDEHIGHNVASDFGKVHFSISCTAASQQQFDRAVAMLHSFFYPETEKAFQAIAQQEPSCAMAYWGIAISQRPNPLTAPFAPALLKQGWEAVQKARAAAPKTQRERDWIEALAAFFQDYDTLDQRTRSARYETAMARLHNRYSSDIEAAAFHALALLEAVDLTDKKYSKQLQAAQILERLQKAQPGHPGAVHYLIHSYDYAPIASKGLPAARRYASLAPSAPHALHMPSHIFSTLGMWKDAIQSNLAADAANRAYAASTNPASAANPASIAARYHNLDFLVNAYLQLGQDQRAKAVVDERNSAASLPAAAGMTSQTGFAALAVRYAFERGAWKEAAMLPPISTPFKQADAIIWFARSVGAARSADAASARQSLSEVSRLQKELVAAGDPYWAEQVGIQETAASAWIALAENDSSRAVTLMQQAADLEDRSEKHIAMENRLSPMREMLGELLLASNRPAEALREFERSLRVVPNRFRSLAGAGQAAEQSGNRKLAESYYKQLLAMAVNPEGERPAITNARAFLAHAQTDELGVPGFHHLHLNSTNPAAAIDFYTKQFPSTSKVTFAGAPALQSPNNVLILFNRVTKQPALEPQSAFWHFGWHVTDVRKTMETYRNRPEVKLLPLYTTDEGGSVYISSDTWPGRDGVLGLTKSQIAEAKATGVKPAGGAGFAYLQGPDSAIVEYQGNMPAERFNHVHMYREYPFCDQLWYQKHLNALLGARGTAYTEANCKVPRGSDKTWPALEKEGMYRTPAAPLTFGDVALNSYMRPGEKPLVSTRGQLMDHFALSVTNLDAWIQKLRSEGVRFLEQPYKLGDLRAVMIEGPSREAIELVEAHR